MKKSVRTAASALLAAPLLAAVFAAPAQAAPEDVTLSATTEGKDMIVTITNNSESKIDCRTYTSPMISAVSADLGPVDVSMEVDPGSADSARVTAKVRGEHTIDWLCDASDGSEYWGTFRGTAEPVEITFEDRTFGSVNLIVSQLLESIFES
ncbi:hypothetical protein [Rhodococcus spongiicola]|uniref:Uncharacterized protein n=1 Tax=Rhodococcus spongiicola TaxID=2487352 RepID=A0A438B5E6_9NOCA|nr:hypothetical protein [Rhodococcus spongiicola]RVW06206.1 hypothetical protein EF834_01755 [Rhodococcus spongiicola]